MWTDFEQRLHWDWKMRASEQQDKSACCTARGNCQAKKANPSENPSRTLPKTRLVDDHSKDIFDELQAAPVGEPGNSVPPLPLFNEHSFDGIFFKICLYTLTQIWNFYRVMSKFRL